jgi:hypothetical protein
MADLTTLEKDGVGQDPNVKTGGVVDAGTPPAKPAAAAPAAPAKPAGDKAPAAPAAKPAAPAPAPAKPGEKTLDWKTTPTEFRAAHEKALAENQRITTELNAKIQTTEGKIRELEQRRFWTAEEEERYKKLQDQSEQLQAQVYAMDYRLSPEFKTKYEQKRDKILEDVKGEVSAIKVKHGDGERDATMGDFARIMEGKTLGSMRKIAKEIFGDDAEVMLKYASDLKTVGEQANEEISQRQANYATERNKQQALANQDYETGRTTFTAYDAALVKAFPGKLSPLEGNAEFNDALKKGLDYIDGLSRNFSQQTVQQRANNTALSRRMAAGFFGAQILISQRDAEITELKSAIAKLQGSDPGSGGDGGAGGGAGGGQGAGGSDSLADQIDKLQV